MNSPIRRLGELHKVECAGCDGTGEVLFRVSCDPQEDRNIPCEECEGEGRFDAERDPDNCDCDDCQNSIWVVCCAPAVATYGECFPPEMRDLALITAGRLSRKYASVTVTDADFTFHIEGGEFRRERYPGKKKEKTNEAELE